MDKFCSNWREFHDDIVELFSSEEPCFLSRVGGSDTDALIDFVASRNSNEEALREHIVRHLPICERYNGFYELGNEKGKSYIKYLNKLHSCYLKAKIATFVHSHFLSIYFPDQIHERFISKNIPNRDVLEEFVDSIVSRPSFTKAYAYTFIESVVENPFTLFRAFTKILENRTVLVVSPFASSIAANFKNRKSFFRGSYTYPNFELRLLNTPITYAGIPLEMYPHGSWFETVEFLEAEVRRQDFDIALLGCGSYALPLGELIGGELGKKAIYVGGVLQLYFGIFGRRYNNSYFREQINVDVFIDPIEKGRYLSAIPTSANAAKEAFGAYF